LVAEHEFGMPEEICSAIRWHTTGRPDMTLLEKIIYLADYIEPTRAFDGLDALRKASYEDLDAALALGMSMSLAEVRRSGAEPYFETEKAYTFYQHAAKISE
jgi:nicotinate-nucleotide adenylyltransferase